MRRPRTVSLTRVQLDAVIWAVDVALNNPDMWVGALAVTEPGIRPIKRTTLTNANKALLAEYVKPRPPS